jgi:2-oxoglutarate dehydrogenase E2 component (dihydrolipoamide succinyltransferase)
MRGRGNSVRASGARTNDSTINVTMIAIKVPPLGESIVEATVARWLKREGDTVSQGETLVELETDKITVEVPALQAGVLAKQAHKEGDVVKVGDELGEIEEGAGSVAPRDAAPAAAAGSGIRPATVPGPQPVQRPLVVRIRASMVQVESALERRQRRPTW